MMMNLPKDAKFVIAASQSNGPKFVSAKYPLQISKYIDGEIDKHQFCRRLHHNSNLTLPDSQTMLCCETVHSAFQSVLIPWL